MYDEVGIQDFLDKAAEWVYIMLRVSLFSLMHILAAISLAVITVLAYADSADLSTSSATLSESMPADSAEAGAERSLLHSMGLLESAGLFEAPKAPAAPPPAGLFGVYMIPKGKFVVNYLPIWTNYAGTQTGTSAIDPALAAATVPAKANGIKTVRIFPTQGVSSGQLLAGMYGITNYLNLIVLPTYVSKSASYLTYGGASGATAIGAGSVSANGIGDTYASLLIKLYEGYNQELIFGWGLSFPTGSITESGAILAPNGRIINSRLAYGMQLGDGTYDAIPTLAYTGNYESFVWGVRTQARLPLQSYNSQGWRQGNQFEGTGWIGYNFLSFLSGTLRITGSTQDSIHGADSQIQGLSSSGNPNFYGGQMVKGLVGLSGLMPISLINGGGRIALEAGMPLYINLNGVQMPEKWSLQLSAALLF